MGRDISDVFDPCPLSPIIILVRNNLERHFKVLHHQSILAELTECRISRAKLMLINTHVQLN